MPSIAIHDHGCLVPLRAHRHIYSLIVQVRHHVVLVEELLRLLYHNTRAPQLLIQDIFVIKHAVIRHSRRGRALGGQVARVVERWRILLKRWW